MRIYFAAWFVVLLAATANAAALTGPAVAPGGFSALAAGQPLPTQFRVITIPKVAINQFSFETAEEKTVLRVDSNNSAGSVLVPLTNVVGGANALLEWRWKVSRVLDKADMNTKAGDDFSARVYVFFDVPLEVCRERNARRNRVVPEDALAKMAAKLVRPSVDEGFSRVTVVRSGST